MLYTSKFHWMVWFKYSANACEYGVPVNSEDEANAIAAEQKTMGAIKIRIFAPTLAKQG